MGQGTAGATAEIAPFRLLRPSVPFAPASARPKQGGSLHCFAFVRAGSPPFMSKSPFSVLLPAVVLCACAPEPPVVQDPAAETAAEFPAAAATHVVRGVVRLEGPAPRPERAGVPSGQILQRLGGEAPILEASVVGAGGALPHVFVEVAGAAATWRFDGLPPEGPATPLQIRIDGFRFEPHVAGLGIGQPFVVQNEQALEHNAHLVTRSGTPFNVRLLEGERHEAAGLRQPGRAFVKSDIYPWMRCWLHVRAHPLFAVTDAEGRFALPPLPAGRHRLRFEHERHGVIERDVTLPLPPSEELDVRFGGA